MTEDECKFIEQMYMEMFERMVAFASSSLENRSLAEEAVQESFRIACVKSKEFCLSENPRGWIVLVLKNIIRNMKRNWATADRILTVLFASERGEMIVFEDKVSLEILYGNVSNSDEFQLIKEMAVYGKSYLELAQSRGISLSACKKRIQRAKITLKKNIITT